MGDQTEDVKDGKGTATGTVPAQSGSRPRTKSAKRAAAQRAAAQRAAERRAAAQHRRRMINIGLTAGAAVLVAAAVVLTVMLTSGSGGSKHKSTAAATPSASSSPVPFPSLPAGANAALRTKPTVTAGTGTLSKLAVKTLIQGTGPAVKSGQTITVNYVGVSYTTGKEFDSSWARSQEASFPIGVGQVIKGWDDGLVGVKVGSRVQLDIPADLAYGNTSVNGSPTGPLRFVVDILAAS